MHPLITNFIRGLEMPARPPEDAFLQQGELSLPSSVSPPPAANATSAAASLPRAHQGVWKGLPRRVYTIYQSVYSIYSTYQSATPECLHQSATPERLHQSVYTIYSISPGQLDIWESQHFSVSASGSPLTTNLRWIPCLPPPPSLSAGYYAQTLMAV